MVIKYIQIYNENLKFIKTYTLKHVKPYLAPFINERNVKNNVKKCNDAVLNHSCKISCRHTVLLYVAYPVAV